MHWYILCFICVYCPRLCGSWMKQRSLNLVPTTVLILEKTSIVSFPFQSHGCLGSASCSICLEMCYLLHNWTFQTFVPLPVWYMGFSLYPSKQGNDQPTQNVMTVFSLFILLLILRLKGRTLCFIFLEWCFWISNQLLCRISATTMQWKWIIHNGFISLRM